MAPLQIRKTFSGFAPDLQIDLKRPCISASVRRDATAGDPNDMGLPEHELRPDLSWLWLRPGGAVRMTGDPRARFRSAFS